MRRPTSCPEPVYWLGRHRWRSGQWVKAWFCDGHAVTGGQEIDDINFGADHPERLRDQLRRELR